MRLQNMLKVVPRGLLGATFGGVIGRLTATRV
jgi:hypothetical protein